MSFFNKFSFMSKPARYCSVGYLFSAVSYCSYLTYNDSLYYLKEFRKVGPDKFYESYKYSSNERTNNEFEICKDGAYRNFAGNFCSSVIWPFSMTSHIIPRIVLLANKK